MKLLLDTNVLARILHPRRHRETQEWFRSLVNLRPPVNEICVSTITLYELKRGLRRVGAKKTLEQLDRLVRELRLLPVTASTAERAANLRSRLDVPGSLPENVIIADADLLIAAQAAEEGAILVSSDEGLVALRAQAGVDVRDWKAV